MSTILDKIVADRARYTCEVKTLGPCTIPSPVSLGQFVQDGERIFATENEAYAKFAETKLGHQPTFERAGPREKIFHDPSWTRVAIVTAGGLCPGLNNVIKGLVEILSFDYGVKTIYGIRYGYAGLTPRGNQEPLLLGPDEVDTIHEIGGTILGSARGQQPTEDIVETLMRMNINVLFCIGGDGSLRCARDIAEMCLARRLSISVVGVPKTIDNDLQFVGPSFGFETAFVEATNVIRSAHAEAKGTMNGVGLVKLMGRDSGFITAYAALANPVVNFCLIPEVPFEMDGPTGLLADLERRLAKKHHAVIVAAEGAGQNLFNAADVIRDKSGNLLHQDIGLYLKNRINEHFKQRGIEHSIKYIDPSYIIRSLPATGIDSTFCLHLAQNAVHAAMAGMTDIVVGNWQGYFTYVPIELATMCRRKIDPQSPLWQSVMLTTRQNQYFLG